MGGAGNYHGDDGCSGPIPLNLIINLKHHKNMAFKEAELADHPGVLRVIQYNPELENLPDVLGLTQERQKAMDDIISDSIDKAQSLSHLMQLISKKAENSNELSFMMLNLGAHLKDKVKKEKEKAEKSQDNAPLKKG